MTVATRAAVEFCLPDVGEGLQEADIIEWKVTPGQRVVANQPLVEIETAKSLVELPSPHTGRVLALLAPAGSTVRVGHPIVSIEVETEVQRDGRIELLVGSGPRAEGTRPRRRGARTFGATPVPSLAKPPVRKLARDLGVDLSTLSGSGPSGSVTRADVHAAVRPSTEPTQSTAPTAPAVAAPTARRETRTPIRGVRQATAAAMVASAFTAPHVSEFVTVDVTESMSLLERIRARPEFAGVRLTPLTLLGHAMCLAAARTPEINSYWDEAAHEIATLHYVNLGIAVATDRGLLVPNVKDADRLGLLELANAITDLVATARSGRSLPAQLAGATMTITNIGAFGIDTGTPILPPGQSAIMCLGRIGARPWVVDGQVVARQVTTLGLSFDHRLIDGAQVSQFLADVATILHDPALALVVR